MTDRRPARARKNVDYGKFGDPDDFDDDFADLTPPPSKKPKTSSSKELQKKTTIKQEKKKTKRAPLVEKVYERELQAALELSLVESQSSNYDEAGDDDDFKPKNNKKLNVIKKDKGKTNNVDSKNRHEVLCSVELEVSKQKTNKVENDSETDTEFIEIDDDHTEKVESKSEIDIDHKEKTEKKNDTVNTEKPEKKSDILQEIKINKIVDGNDSDGIIVLDQEEENLGRRGRRKSATKTRVITDDSDDNDSEFTVEDDDDGEDDESDEDYDDENDSDFDCGSKKKKTIVNKKASTPKAPKQVKTKAPAKVVQSKPNIKSKIQPSIKSGPISKGPLCSPVVSARLTVKTPVSRPALTSPVVRTVPKWNPPGSAGSVKSPLGGIAIKSPSSGMRVGLSRNQRVKSLHPGLSPKIT